MFTTLKQKKRWVALKGGTKKMVFFFTIFVITSIWTMTHVMAQDWPVEISLPKAQILIYQPQPESLKGDKLTARSAVSVMLQGRAEPEYGTVWLETRILTDRDKRTVNLLEVDITKVKFPQATPQQEKQFVDLVEQHLAKRTLSISLDHLLTSLEPAETEETLVDDLDTTPPKIIYTTTPSVLVIIDGSPQMEQVENSKIMRVVNSPSVILFDPDTKAYFLYGGGDTWAAARDIMGPWKTGIKPPATVTAVLPPESKKSPTPVEPLKPSSSVPPRIIVATEPTELIVAEGEPKFTPIPGTELSYISNTESHVFMESRSKMYYILLSGRWYRTKSPMEPLEYVPSDQLPPGFTKIPPDSPKAEVLVHVAGTQMAKEALIEASIPQTSAIDRTRTDLKVTYDGPPKFEKIEGTSMRYAVNTSYPIIEVTQSPGNYYCCYGAVWYVSIAPVGPWEVAISIPPVIYTIPPICPLYYVRYVRIFSYTPTVVYTGYYPGYLGCYAHRGTVVFGTGYVYRGWFGSVYYPRPATWGFHAHYNAWTGAWGFSAGAKVGAFSYGLGWKGAWGFHYESHGWWGPGGFRAYRDVDITVKRGVSIDRSRTSINIYNRHEYMARNVDITRGRISGPSRAAKGRENNVFADRDGNIHRKTKEGWENRERNTWSKGARSDSDRGLQKMERPSAPSTGLSQLDRERKARERGNERTSRMRQGRDEVDRKPDPGSRGRERGPRRKD